MNVKNQLEALNVYASFTKEQIREIYDNFDETDSDFFDDIMYYIWEKLGDISNSNVYAEVPEIEDDEEEHFIVFQVTDCLSVSEVNELYWTIINKAVFRNVYINIDIDDTQAHVFDREICQKDINDVVNGNVIVDEIIL